MNSYNNTSVSKTLETIKAARNTPIIIDFDETIFLRNSTSEYLNSIKPRILSALLLQFLDRIEPWNWLPRAFRGEKSRDDLLVIIFTCLFPWNILIWQKRARQLAKDCGNRELIKALQKDDSNLIIIATSSFRFIVNPILRNLPLDYEYSIACNFWHGAIDIDCHNLEMSLKTLETKTIGNFSEDKVLVQQAVLPSFLTRFRAKHAIAMTDNYLPFIYSEKAKRPGQKYLLRVILGDDLIILLLSFNWLVGEHFLWNGLSLLLMLVSFWCIYEVGYFENDRVAEKFEKTPILSDAYKNYKYLIRWWQPWLWSSAIAVCGVLFFQKSSNINLVINYDNSAYLWVSWMFFLLIVRSLFGIYNYLNKKSRIWLYLFLQAARYLGFLVVFSTNAIGTMLLLAQTLSRWIPYAIYRYVGGNRDNWPMKFPRHCLRLSIYILLLISFAFGTSNLNMLSNTQAIAIALFCFLRSSSQLGEIIRQFKPVWLDDSN